MRVFIELKAQFSRRLSSACPLALLRPIVVLTKGRWARPVYKREVRRRKGNLLRMRNNDGGFVGPSNVKAHRLAPTKVLQQFTWSTELGKFLRPKGIIQRGNCETIQIMSCEYLRTVKSYDLEKSSARANKGASANEIMRLWKLCSVNIWRPVNNTTVETFRLEENLAWAVKAFAYFTHQVGVTLAWRYNWWEVFQILGIQWD